MAVERQAQVGAQVVGAGDQPGRLLRDLRRGENAGRGLDHRQHRLAHRVRDSVHQMRRNGARNDDEIGLGPSDGIEVERMPLGPDAIDPDRDWHRPGARDRLDRRLARRVLVLRLHRILEVEHDEVGARLARLRDGARIRRGQEQQRPHGEQVDALVAFSLPLRVIAVASCPGYRDTGEETC